MVALIFSTTILSCSQLLFLINNVSKVVGLTQQQKIDLVTELRKTITTCPIKINGDFNARNGKKSCN